jgi:predicted adenylyl cyclase CyaB
MVPPASDSRESPQTLRGMKGCTVPSTDGRAGVLLNLHSFSRSAGVPSMPSNVEIKAILKNRPRVEAIAAQLSDAGPEVILQEDIFFRCDGARLKLRILGPERGELIRYERADVADTRCSRYRIARTSDPQVLLDILTRTLGRTGVVKKTRTLYLIGQTRVHLDQVQDLGDFLELEVVLRPPQSESEGKNIAEALLSSFKIDRQQLVGEAYIDLLARRAE